MPSGHVSQLHILNTANPNHPGTCFLSLQTCTYFSLVFTDSPFTSVLVLYLTTQTQAGIPWTKFDRHSSLFRDGHSAADPTPGEGNPPPPQIRWRKEWFPVSRSVFAGAYVFASFQACVMPIFQVHLHWWNCSARFRVRLEAESARAHRTSNALLSTPNARDFETGSLAMCGDYQVCIVIKPAVSSSRLTADAGLQLGEHDHSTCTELHWIILQWFHGWALCTIASTKLVFLPTEAQDFSPDQSNVPVSALESTSLWVKCSPPSVSPQKTSEFAEFFGSDGPKPDPTKLQFESDGKPVIREAGSSATPAS